MFNKKKVVIDERQELQSLKNAKICFDVTLLLLGISILLQVVIYPSKPMQYLPETVILFIISILNIAIDVKQGNLYTKDMQNYKRNMILYISASLFIGLVVGIGNFINYGFSPLLILAVTVPIFLLSFALMLFTDFAYRKFAYKKLKKLEGQMTASNEDTEQ